MPPRVRLVALFLRLALAAGFLSAVAGAFLLAAQWPAGRGRK